MRIALAVAFSLTATAAIAGPFDYTWHQLAPNVWAGIREDAFALPQEGNTVVVVTNDGVVVFDAGGSPLMGESIVAKVRSLTDRPITDVIISHWHGDHMRGLQAIQSAYPTAAIVSHPYARDFIASSQEKWLKRRVTMVPNIRNGFAAAVAAQHDLSGRPLIADEKSWLENGLAITDQLDRENNRTTFVVPNTTFNDRLVLHRGGTEIQFLHLGNAHTAGDVVMWLPRQRIIATGDIVSAPVPLMPTAYVLDYPAVLQKIKALDFTVLVPGHGSIQTDAKYIDLLNDTIQSVTKQMTQLVANGTTREKAIAGIDFSSVESRFTGDSPFLKNRFEDYVVKSLPAAAYDAISGAGVHESF